MSAERIEQASRKVRAARVRRDSTTGSAKGRVW